MLNILFLIASFLNGYLMMSSEVLASRLLAPAIGTSIFVWTALITVVLLFSALGSGLVGYHSKFFKQRTQETAPILYAFLSIYLFLIYYIGEKPLVMWATKWENADRFFILIGVTLYIAVPMFVIGMLFSIVTYSILSTKEHDDSLRWLSIASVLGTAGSAIGTLGTGYFLLQYLGVRDGFLSITSISMLMMVAFTLQVSHKPLKTALLVLFSGLLLCMAFLGKINLFKTTIAEINSPLQRMLITDVSGKGFHQRRMVTGTIYASIIDPDHPTEIAGMDYLKIFLGAGAFRHPENLKKAALLGSAGYIFPTLLQKYYPNLTIDAVDIEPLALDVAKEYFFFENHGKVNPVTQDARWYMTKQSSESLDAIFFDAYAAEYLPFHLGTMEALRLYYDKLKNGGVFMMNQISGSQCPLTSIQARMIEKIFGNVRMFGSSNNGVYLGNVVFVAVKGSASVPEPDIMAAFSKQNNIPFEYADIHDKLYKEFPEMELTDDFSPIEKVFLTCLRGD